MCLMALLVGSVLLKLKQIYLKNSRSNKMHFKYKGIRFNFNGTMTQTGYILLHIDICSPHFIITNNPTLSMVNMPAIGPKHTLW